MVLTEHSKKRFAQRGISRSLVSLVMAYGQLDKTCRRWTLGTKKVEKEIEFLKAMITRLEKIKDKGGLTVVEENGVIVTAWCGQS